MIMMTTTTTTTTTKTIITIIIIIYSMQKARDDIDRMDVSRRRKEYSPALKHKCIDTKT